MNIEAKIHNNIEDYCEYLKDESRFTGKASSISFPETEDEIKQILNYIKKKNIPITIQGSRTGITGGAVPYNGHIMNLSRMKNILALRKDDALSQFYVTLQPGVLLSEINANIFNKDFNTKEWNEKSKSAYSLFRNTGMFFFPPDPTETSASLGGMTACNASGASSLLYGPTRNYIEAIHLVFPDTSSCWVRRNMDKAIGRSFSLNPEGGKKISGSLPSYSLPAVKNASGYFAKDNMDLVDLFIGSEGTLGIITRIEIRIIPAPKDICALVIFFPKAEEALNFVKIVRKDEGLKSMFFPLAIKPAAIEYFDENSLYMLKNQKEHNPAFASLPEIKAFPGTAVYIEYHSDESGYMDNTLNNLPDIIKACGGNEDNTWFASNSNEIERLKTFRHAVPEAVNLAVDLKRKMYPAISKLGTDMAFPNEKLAEIYKMYTDTLCKAGLEYVIFGHIGDNHLHVNIIPHVPEEFDKGKLIYKEWAKKIINTGGTVSAEHGIGKLKNELLALMYGEKGIKEMKCIKELFDPENILNPGNLF